ncbi:hypothetical protein DH2020_004848 [Rehmannia glutinosa]|uniref:Uncharacterized protein n=1 Tax=Rehmannia glutinosa TaxID=99300 RepID=A0ABR0XQN3_REHGL
MYREASYKGRNVLAATEQGLISQHGDFCTDQGSMAGIIVAYFNDLFSTASPTGLDMEEILQHISPKVDDQVNDILCNPFDKSEVKKAVFQMFPDKVLRSGRLDNGEEVSRAILGVLNHGDSLEEWNSTIVTLIPKVENPLLVKEFWPINLWNTCKDFWVANGVGDYPTTVNLKRHHVPLSKECPLCHFGVDTTIHTAFVIVCYKTPMETNDLWTIKEEGKWRANVRFCVGFLESVDKGGLREFGHFLMGSLEGSIFEGELRAMLYGMEVLMEQQFLSLTLRDSLLAV